jgi:hypothetical protein
MYVEQRTRQESRLLIFRNKKISELVVPCHKLYNFSGLVTCGLSRLGGVVANIVTGPKGSGFEPGQGDGFIRAIKIRSTTSFGWEVKAEVPCRKILRHVKHLLKSHGDGYINSHFLRPFSYSLQRCLCRQDHHTVLVAARALW